MFRLTNPLFQVCSLCLTAWLVLPAGLAWSADDATNSAQVAAQVDDLINAELARKQITPVGLVHPSDDLRRLTLDLAGRIPTPDEVRNYLADDSTDKRTKKIEELLNSRDYARNWAAYWRDVIYSRATDARTERFSIVFDGWMTQQLADNASWADITTEILTATGDARENGANALMLAHGGDAEEIAGEVSRVFLGIQIQCAKCHNHPTDAWTRDQFHELAAFFPRVRVRLQPNQTPPTFEVVSYNYARPDPSALFRNPTPIMRLTDANRDGKVTLEEAKRLPRLSNVFERLVGYGDRDGDGAMSVEEFQTLPEPPGNRNNNIEHFMSDLEDPAAKGDLKRPSFFLDEQKVTTGLSDVARRETLARQITDPNNEWFAKAYVNRIWKELLGVGFYTPVDDIGPLRIARHEKALNLLSEQFAEHSFDVRWLFETITQTEAYQRQLTPTDSDSADAVQFACATPTRLRSDQLFDTLQRISGVNTGRFQLARNRGRMGLNGEMAMRYRSNEKRRFAEVFGFDPSTPQTDVQGNIPQALFLMNSNTIESLISAQGGGPLARLLRQYDDDETVLRELYLLTLSREPTDREIEICQQHYLASSNRTETLEDIFWSLLNSSEFVTKR